MLVQCTTLSTQPSLLTKKMSLCYMKDKKGWSVTPMKAHTIIWRWVDSHINSFQAILTTDPADKEAVCGCMRRFFRLWTKIWLPHLVRIKYILQYQQLRPSRYPSRNRRSVSVFFILSSKMYQTRGPHEIIVSDMAKYSTYLPVYIYLSIYRLLFCVHQLRFFFYWEVTVIHCNRINK